MLFLKKKILNYKNIKINKMSYTYKMDKKLSFTSTKYIILFII